MLDAAQVRALITPAAAVEALRQRLLHDPPRTDRPLRSRVPVDHGQLLLMPDQGDRFVGVKVVSLAPGNPALGLPTVQGTYLLMDAPTLSPIAVLDAAELTLVRTAALTVLGVLALAPVDAPRVLVIGSGPQAAAHAEAAAVLGPSDVTVLARSGASADRVGAALAARSVGATVVTDAALGSFDVVMCCTASRAPVLETHRLAADVVVAAIGSHEPDTRELPTDLLGSAFVCVESTEVARREAGDVVMAEHELGRTVVDATLAALVTDPHRSPRQGRRVLKTVGEAWQDLTVATVVVH